ncbi:TPA: phage antirepressor KilAC domain-containing protein [Clostridioides difficile]|uniref:phage antirepressor KilAC domain-containing protein n=2 Tax=Clostridioides difficile TaxID=1496 RepID=UPI00142FAF0E|nr:phage antirepressor KilAC domain-containing protein [Clostridioides difficile]NJJ73227.1 phage regulatory protein [Clostridioides difficile]HBF5775177.1 phage antirepressor KilAC domain-containing protein [Clostridioides difficile]HBF6659681.1 phage antirepressor KilAC domain-containing protein [Clostridioides difficile]HBG7128535.1 phage antirepressor KilAC domain-containing protein [Clostridioides difficile]HBH1346683.1 phage antirepressor KilAC domain-containing protein [Clostridioides d
MNNLVLINDKKLQVKEFKGERVVTFKEIDLIHERAEGTAKRNFTENKKYFIENIDYFEVSTKIVPSLELYGFSKFAPNGILITESGYLMLVKSLTDDLAWTVQRELVNNYFRVKENEQQPKLPTTYKEALQQLLIEVEEKEQLQLENQEKDKVIQLQQPKVLFADAVSASNNSILVGELAKLIKQNGVDIGQNRLFAWMRENGYLIKRKGEDYNIPTQKSMNLGIMEVKKRVINNPDGSTKVTRTVKITGKGQVYFVNKFKSSKQLSMLS